MNVGGFGQIYLNSGSVATDAAATLTLLPAESALEYLGQLCAALEDVDARNAISVVRAILDVVFPVEAYQEGNELNPAQKKAIEAIAASDLAWVFDANLHEVLYNNGLPSDRDTLRALVTGEEVQADTDGSHTSAAFGGPSSNLDSFRKR